MDFHFIVHSGFHTAGGGYPLLDLLQHATTSQLQAFVGPRSNLREPELKDFLG